jgi:hypothetical protein
MIRFRRTGSGSAGLAHSRSELVTQRPCESDTAMHDGGTAGLPEGKFLGGPLSILRVENPDLSAQLRGHPVSERRGDHASWWRRAWRSGAG